MSHAATHGEDYLLVLAGLPSHWTWTTLKDDIRNVIKGQPGHAEVNPSSRPSGGNEAWCRLSQEEDAFAALNHYGKRRGFNVHVFATSIEPGAKYALMGCNCSKSFEGVAEGAHSPVRSGIDIHAVENIFKPQQNPAPQTTAQAQAPMAYQYQYQVYPRAQGQPYQAYPPAQGQPYYQPALGQVVYSPTQGQAYSPSQGYSYGYPVAVAGVPMAAPMYSVASNGMPVNTSGGAMITESRGIFISGLNFKCGTADLRTLLRTVGRPIELQLVKDKTGKSKGAATAKFATRQEAARAVEVLNKFEHMGKTLKVRFDTESTIVGEVQGPAIANGSRTQLS